MPTAAELDARTACADLQRALDAERVCNRNHLAHIARLNALSITLHQEIEHLTRALAHAQAEAADLRAGSLDAGALRY
jgi:hypothetical protein